MNSKDFSRTVLERFNKGEVSLEKLERMHVMTQESFARRPTGCKGAERDGIDIAIKTIKMLSK